MSRTFAIVLGVLCVGMVGGSSTVVEGAKKRIAEQKYCPVFTDQIVGPDSRFLRYKGIRVYFSSDLATRKWMRDPVSYLDADVLPQLDGLTFPERPMEQMYCPVTKTRKISTRDPSVIYQEKRIYLFDNQAVRVFNSAPEKFIDPAILPQFAEEEPADGDETTNESGNP